MTERKPTIVLLGIGNEFRGDDAAGLLIVRRFREIDLRGVPVIEETGDGARLLDAWSGSDFVFVFDAVRSNAAPGTIHRLNVLETPPPPDWFIHSSHAFGLAEALELGRQMNRLPTEMIVYGISGRNFELGAAISEEVATACDTVFSTARDEILKRLS